MKTSETTEAIKFLKLMKRLKERYTENERLKNVPPPQTDTPRETVPTKSR